MEYSTSRRNPYIIGRPIDEPKLFFGREDVFYFIEDNLIQKSKVILLHGQRRIGKTSVLQQIPRFFEEKEIQEFLFINFDLQDKGSLSLSQVLEDLATEIIEQIVYHLQLIPEDKLTPPTAADLASHLNIFSHEFLSQVFQELGSKNLVFLLDEFDVLERNDTTSAYINLFPYLKVLIEEHERLSIIPVVGRNLEELQKLLDLFKGAPYKEIGLLDQNSAKRLITYPAKNILEYDEDALQAILELSAGHPYFTQVICFAIFGRARELENWQVTRADVNAVVDKAIESAEAGLAWFFDGLSIPERVIVSAVAEAQKIAILNKEQPQEPLTLLQSYGIKTETFEETANQLKENEVLWDDKECKVKVELVRLWLLKRHPLRDEIRELEKLESEQINHLWKVANERQKNGNQQDALADYEVILAINPNHFRTIEALAERYVELGNLKKAVELYTRAYQFNSVRNKEDLLRSLQAYGKDLVERQEFTKAKEQFQRVLEIESDNSLALEKLQEISAAIKLEVLNRKINIDSESSPHFTKNRPIVFPAVLPVIGVVVLIIIAVIGMIIYQWSTPCPKGQQKGEHSQCTNFP